MQRRETSLVLSFRQKLESRDICFTPGLIYLLIPLHGSVGEVRSACKATLTYSSAGSQPLSFSPSEHFQPFQNKRLPVRVGDQSWVDTCHQSSVIDDLPSKLLSIVSSSEKCWPWSLPPRPSRGKVSDRHLGRKGAGTGHSAKSLLPPGTGSRMAAVL